jgi:polar amino acid transport system substrate-binding protein
MAFRLNALAGALLGITLGALQPALADTSVLDRVSRTGRLNTLVMDSDLPYTTQQGNGYVGLGMEFAKEIQKELSDYAGKPVQLIPQPIDSVEQGIAAIASGNVDLACGVGFSWGRSMFVDYSLPIALSGTRLITPAGNDGTPAALAGQTVGAVTNTLAAQTIEKSVPGAKLQTFDTPAAALAALKSGQIQFLAGDSLWLLANLAAAAPTGSINPTVPYSRAAVSCIVPENNSGLLNLSNLAIARLMQAYINDDPSAQSRINQWVGPGSAVNLSQDAIKAYFTNVLLTAAVLSLQ